MQFPWEQRSTGQIRRDKRRWKVRGHRSADEQEEILFIFGHMKQKKWRFPWWWTWAEREEDSEEEKKDGEEDEVSEDEEDEEWEVPQCDFNPISLQQ